VPQFGNGRDIETLVKRVSRHIDTTRKDSITNSDGMQEVTEEEFEIPLKQFVVEKRIQTPLLPSPGSSNIINHKFLTQTANDTPIQTNTKTTTATSDNNNNNHPEKNLSNNNNDSDDDVKRDAGVSDAIWWELQRAKQLEKERERKEREEMLRLEEEKRKKEEERRIAEQRRKEAEELLKKETEEKRRKELQAEKEKAELLAKQAQERWENHQRELTRLESERRKREQLQQRLKSSGLCPMGYAWIPLGNNGYRCAGGSHFQNLPP